MTKVADDSSLKRFSSFICSDENVAVNTITVLFEMLAEIFSTNQS